MPPPTLRGRALHPAPRAPQAAPYCDGKSEIDEIAQLITADAAALDSAGGAPDNSAPGGMADGAAAAAAAVAVEAGARPLSASDAKAGRSSVCVVS